MIKPIAGQPLIEDLRNDLVDANLNMDRILVFTEGARIYKREVTHVNQYHLVEDDSLADYLEENFSDNKRKGFVCREGMELYGLYIHLNGKIKSALKKISPQYTDVINDASELFFL